MNVKKHAVVTGGGTGVGASIALKLSDSCSKVTILGRREEVLKTISEKKDNINYRICDVSKYDEVEGCYNDIRKKYGNISIVVANAGIAKSKPFNKMSVEDITSLMDINLVGVFNSFKLALEDMKSFGWGRMIAISSTAGLKGYSYVSSYCASKHAVIGLIKSLSLELAKEGITVNAICPSYVDTPMTDRTIKNIMQLTKLSAEEALKQLVKSNPQKKLIQPIEIAETIDWLCNNHSNSINGQSISISGGEI